MEKNKADPDTESKQEMNKISYAVIIVLFALIIYNSTIGGAGTRYSLYIIIFWAYLIYATYKKGSSPKLWEGAAIIVLIILFQVGFSLYIGGLTTQKCDQYEDWVCYNFITLEEFKELCPKMDVPDGARCGEIKEELQKKVGVPRPPRPIG